MLGIAKSVRRSLQTDEPTFFNEGITTLVEEERVVETENTFINHL